MPVRSVLLSSLIVVAFGAAGSQAPRAQSQELLKADQLHDIVRATATQPDAFAMGESADLKGRVASATRPLDLRKLSMSDFGDVEQPR